MNKVEYNTYFNRNVRPQFKQMMNKEVIITDEAVMDSKIPMHKGILEDVFYEECNQGYGDKRDFYDYARVKVLGATYVVGLHEISDELILDNK